MAEIQGKYDVFAHIPNASYTFTGNDRNATFGISNFSGPLDLRCLSCPSTQSAKVAIPVENDVTIKRVKIWPVGAYGLQNSPSKMAAGMSLLVGGGDSSDFKLYHYTALVVPNWGEWFEVNLKLKPYRRISGDNSYNYVGFAIDKDETLFSLDDFNIQDIFISDSQVVTPAIEMEIETAGLAIVGTSPVRIF